MNSASHNNDNNELKEEKIFQNNIASRFFYPTCITLITIFYFVFYQANTLTHRFRFNFNNKNIEYLNDTHIFVPTTNASNKEIEACDLFKGRWVRDTSGSSYTDYSSCTELNWSENCLVHSRNDTDYLDWKWKPDRCELPRFDAVTFLSILRGKKMAFIGDSLARGQVESLVCLLSTVETPNSKVKSKELHIDRTWEFPVHNVTIASFWSPFLVAATETADTKTYDIHLDRVDTNWSEKLPSIDFAVFSSSHWFMRICYLYEGGRLVGSVYWDKPETAYFGPGRAIRMAFRAALQAVNGCVNCKKIVSFVRTFSPPHFENASGSDRGTCNRTRPVEREELNRALPGWEYSEVQAEEAEAARREGKRKGNEFEFLNVTEMMAMRVDAHPGRFWEWTGGRDCLHWCLPGPVDTWNALLLERIKRLNNIS